MRAKNSSARADSRDAGLMMNAQVGVIRCSFDGGCGPGLAVSGSSIVLVQTEISRC